MYLQICGILSTTIEYESEDITMINNKIHRYIVDATDVYPTLTQKVKTHLSTHIVSTYNTK